MPRVVVRAHREITVSISNLIDVGELMILGCASD